MVSGRDAKRAAALGLTEPEYRGARRRAVEEWTTVIRSAMAESNVEDPVQILPDLFATVVEKGHRRGARGWQGCCPARTATKIDIGSKAMKDPDPLNLRSDDPLTKWRCDAEHKEALSRAQHAEDERERRRREKRQVQDVSETLRAELAQEIADVRTEAKTRSEVTTEVVAEKLEELGSRVIDIAERLVKDSERELYRLVEKRFAELQAKLEVVMPEPRSREAKDFRFASERADEAGAEVVDLPDWRTRTKMN